MTGWFIHEITTITDIAPRIPPTAIGIPDHQDARPGHVLAAITARETPGVTSIAIDDVGLDTALRRATAATRT